MLIKSFKRTVRSTARPILILMIAAALVFSSANIVYAVAPAFSPAAVVAAVIPVVASSTQFDITGFLQSATVNNTADPHSGGVLTVNGHTVIVPAETIVILPANALTWQELFTHAPAPYTGTATGMALNDLPKPLTTYEVHVVGNRVINGNGDRYIAGMVDISQQGLNSGQGYINFINYATGEMEVGGTPGAAGTGTRLQINDPAVGLTGTGRYGRAVTPDDRFQVDQDNPTIAAETGFPMCLPRTDPAAADDPLCPQANRPVINAAATDQSGITPQPNTLIAGQFYTLFRMDSPANIDTNPLLCLRTPCADPRIQAPFEIGDYVTFAGNIIQDGGANGGYYVSAHTITASLGIYTQPGIDPAYVTIEVSLIGTGGLTVFGAGEAAVRTRIEGMTTDESRMIRVYGVDINPATGATSDREWGTIFAQVPPLGAVRGRWRLRPPCTAAIATDKVCTPPPAGQYIPPTRELRAVITGLSQFVPGTITPNAASQIPVSPAVACTYVNGFATNQPCTTANGIFYGQYHAPIGEYIFPENVPGTAVPEANFNTINFLAYGGYQSITGVQAGVLNPWPSSFAPAALVCAGATLNGAPYSVASGGSIQLSGSVTAGATTPVKVQWIAGTSLHGTNLNGALTGASTTTPIFNALGLVAGTYFLDFAAANPCGVSTTSSTIVVQAAPPPTINAIQNQNVTAGNPVTINASSASLPAPTWAWLQTGGPANPIITQTPSAATASATSSIAFTPTIAGIYTYSVTATNANGTSPATTVTVSVTASVPTNITFGGTLEYRISKQRLVMTATSTDPTITGMTLMPYLTDSGTIFDPATLGASLTISLVTPGTWTITAVGAPKPACNLVATYATPCSQTPITVKAWFNVPTNYVGTSGPTAMQKIRN